MTHITQPPFRPSTAHHPHNPRTFGSFRRFRAIAALMFAGALALSACSSAGPEPPPASDARAVSVADNGTASAPLGSPDSTKKEEQGSPGSQLAVSNVRVGRHDTFDRVVLDFSGEGTPGWFARTTSSPGQAGSGFPVEFKGATSIDLQVNGLAMPSELDGGYHDIGIVPGAGGVVTEVVAGTWFEGQSQFVIGLPQDLPYSIQVIENPTRLVVDILHKNAGIPPPAEADTAPKDHEPSDDAQLVVTDVRIGRHAGFDRVVLDLTGEGLPGWHTRFNTNPVHDGSGFPVNYDGATSIDISVRGIAIPSEVGIDNPHIGPVPGAGGPVTGVDSAGWFEGRSQSVIGLTEELPYSIEVFENPTRIVVDILHHNPDSPGDGEDIALSPLGDPNVEDKSQASGPPPQRAISGVRLAAHEGFDRVVFDTVGEGTTGWFTSYTSDPAAAGSGLPVEFEGNIALEVNLTGVVHPSDLGQDHSLVDSVPGAGGVVTEAITTLTHHGTSQFIIGLTGELPYSIQILEDPQRVVIDILHE